MLHCSIEMPGFQMSLHVLSGEQPILEWPDTIRLLLLSYNCQVGRNAHETFYGTSNIMPEGSLHTRQMP